MPPRRSAGLIAVVATVASLLPGSAVAQRTPVEEQSVAVAADPVNLTELRREAEKASKDLEAATKALEQRRAQITASGKQLSAKLRELQAAERAFAQMRQQVAFVEVHGNPQGGLEVA